MSRMYCVCAGIKKGIPSIFYVASLYCSLVNTFLLRMARGVRQITNLTYPTSIAGQICQQPRSSSMPRTFLARPPGGATGMVRKRYAVRQKLQLLEEVSRLRQSENLSVRGAAAKMGIPHSTLVGWRNDRHRHHTAAVLPPPLCRCWRGVTTAAGKVRRRQRQRYSVCVSGLRLRDGVL